MGQRKPGRREVVDVEFPVRLTIAAFNDPALLEATRLWLQRHVGPHGYATTPAHTWSGARATHVHLRDVQAAAMFVLGNPHIRLLGERYDGPVR